MVEEYAEDFADEHRFQIPDGCHWDDIRSTAQNVGAALKHAMQEIERVNPDTLYRVFGTGDWGNKEKFTDELIKDMIEGFSAIELGNNAVDTDVLGDAYEYLVGKFADVTRRNKAGEFYTPRSVVRMMVEILDPKEGESIYDPACGTGGMLLAAIDHVKRQGGDPRTFFGKIYGQEKNLTTSSVARMNLVLHGIEDFQIAREDTLRNPAFTDGAGGLAKFDCVIANPPFSLKDWGRDIWENDPWGRAQYGLPPKNFADMAWVQHMVKSMAAPKGKMAVVLPHGPLFRGRAEGAVREALIKEDLVETVIGLADDLFYGTGISACILVLNRNKDVKRRGKILFIDARALFKADRAQNFLESSHVDHIVQTHRNFSDVQGLARVVTTEGGLENEGLLYLPRYVEPVVLDDLPDLVDSVSALTGDLCRLRSHEKEMRKELSDEVHPQ